MLKKITMLILAYISISSALADTITTCPNPATITLNTTTHHFVSSVNWQSLDPAESKPATTPVFQGAVGLWSSPTKSLLTACNYRYLDKNHLNHEINLGQVDGMPPNYYVDLSNKNWHQQLPGLKCTSTAHNLKDCPIVSSNN
jgi:hypothetical protein